MTIRNFISLFCLCMLLSIGIDAQGFQLKDETGKVHALTDYKGKWVLINFWATWCPPCLEEIPDLIALYESREDIMIIGVAMDYANPEVVMDFVDSLAIPYPTVLGSREIASQIDDITMLPTTYLFDPAGQPAARKLGLISREDIEEFIKLESVDSLKNDMSMKP